MPGPSSSVILTVAWGKRGEGEGGLGSKEITGAPQKKNISVILLLTLLKWNTDLLIVKNFLHSYEIGEYLWKDKIRILWGNRVLITLGMPLSGNLTHKAPSYYTNFIKM